MNSGFWKGKILKLAKILKPGKILNSGSWKAKIF